jgi:DNA-directed RNA polymerase specialized sigma subunit
MIAEEEIILFLESEEDVKKNLQIESEKLLAEIKEIESQRAEIEKDIIETLQSSIRYDTEGGGSSGKKRDLGNVLSMTKKILEEQIDSLTYRYRLNLVRIEKNHRLRLVLATLPPLSKEVLIRIYRKKEKWEYIEQRLDISHSKLARLKKKALQDVCEIYDSSYTNRQLAKLKNTTTVTKKEVKMEGREAVLPGQLKITDKGDFGL